MENKDMPTVIRKPARMRVRILPNKYLPKIAGGRDLPQEVRFVGLVNEDTRNAVVTVGAASHAPLVEVLQSAVKPEFGTPITYIINGVRWKFFSGVYHPRGGIFGYTAGMHGVQSEAIRIALTRLRLRARS